MFSEYELLGKKLTPGQSGDLDTTDHTLVLPDSSQTVTNVKGNLVGWKIVTENTNIVHLSVWEHEVGNYR